MQVVDLIQGTQPWLDWKKDKYGASETPIIAGFSPYRSARDLFLEKTSLIKPKEDESKKYIFSLGHQTESLIRDEFQKLTNVEMNPICLAHKEFDYIICSLDGFDKNLGVLEAKLAGYDVLQKAKSGMIPKHHLAQMQHQMAVAEVDRGIWFGHDGKNNGVVVEVKYDKFYADMLLNLVHTFRKDVLEMRMPALSDLDYLIPEDERLLKELRDAKEHAENAQAHFESLKEKVINTYNHSKISGGGIKVYKTIREVWNIKLEEKKG